MLMTACCLLYKLMWSNENYRNECQKILNSGENNYKTNDQSSA